MMDINEQFRDAKYGLYIPPEPFSAKEDLLFQKQISMMLLSTRRHLEWVFSYVPTPIEWAHLRKQAERLAYFYSTNGIDPASGHNLIRNIPMEIFSRFLLDQGWSMEEVYRLYEMSEDDQYRFLHLYQDLEHHQ